MSGQTGLDNLPDELLLCIVKATRDGLPLESTATLHALCLTSQRLNQITTPILYQQIVSTNTNPCSPLQLGRTLLQRPTLAHWVKSIDVNWAPTPCRPHSRSLCDKELQLFTFKLQQLGIPEINQWIEAFKANNRINFLALLVCLAPNLEQLAVNRGNEFSDGLSSPASPLLMYPILNAAQNNPFGNVHSFSRLADVEICVSILSLSRTLGILNLPSLRRLSILPGHDWNNEGIYEKSIKEIQSWKCPSRSSSLQYLQLLSCRLPYQVVCMILDSIKQLKGFYCQEGTRYIPSPEFNQEVGLALSDHADSLEELILDHPKLQPGGITTSQLPHIATHFPKLKKLDASISAIFDEEETQLPNQLARIAEMLPTTLTNLRLNVPWGWAPANFVDLQHPETCPSLPYLSELRVRHLNLSIPRYALLALPKYFAETNVPFTLRIEVQNNDLIARNRLAVRDGEKGMQYAKHATMRQIPGNDWGLGSYGIWPRTSYD